MDVGGLYVSTLGMLLMEKWPVCSSGWEMMLSTHLGILYYIILYYIIFIVYLLSYKLMYICPSYSYLYSAPSNVKPTWIASFSCSFTDQELSECNHGNPIGYANCFSFADAALDCG